MFLSKIYRQNALPLHNFYECWYQKATSKISAEWIE